MRVKYNRVSTLQQTGERFTADTEKYDMVLLDKVSGKVAFNERAEGKKLFDLIKEGKVKEVVVEELSRLGRNTGDVIRTLEKFEDLGVNVIIRNLGIQSRPQGKKNPIWKMISSVLSSMYEMELENIKERTMVGRQVYLMNGGVLGRPQGTSEGEKKFLEKPLTKKIIGKIQEGRSVIEISKYLYCSSTTVVKSRRIGKKYGLVN
jgi:DNA invertase Pin-like site-specific DNA recombinase